MEHKYIKTYELKQIIKLWADHIKYQNHDQYADASENFKRLNELSIEFGFPVMQKQYYGNNLMVKYNIRLFYVAYGLLRKRQYIQIEQPRNNNQLNESNWNTIHSIMNHFKEKEEISINE